jgi:hypothetical protein
MASRQNIRFSNPNFTTDGEYFYSLSSSGNALQVKTDDGTTAFSYPCDTTITNTVNSLEYDGVYFWSLENRTGGGFIIRKWAIDAYVCKQIIAFTFTNTAVHTYSANDFAVEHYRLSLKDNIHGSDYTYGQQDINISDTSMLSPGDTLTFVRKGTSTQNRYSSSYVETATVQTVLDTDTVRLTGLMTGDPYGDLKGFRGPAAAFAPTEQAPPDLVYVTKALWVLNDNAPSDVTKGALYKINHKTGANIVQYSGTQYKDIKGATFYTKYVVAGSYPNQYNTTISGNEQYVIFVSGSSVLFFNVYSLEISKSLAINNVKADLTSLWIIYDMAVGGFEPNITLYRLQLGTTYGTPAADESWSSTYSYEKTILRRVVNSIAMTAEPTILPADGVSTSVITAVVRDQYNNVAGSGVHVVWTDDSGGSRVTPTSDTNAFGVAYATYTAGTIEDDIKITATIANGLL